MRQNERTDPGGDVFRECRERVSAREAARRYGLRFDRRGWAVCPFHRDRHPSMSFRGGRFRCWACNAAGDSIDFTGRLLGLEPLAAVERLNADFGLDLPLGREPTPEEREAVRRRREDAAVGAWFEEWRRAFTLRLCAAFRAGHFALRDMEDWDALTEADAEAIRRQACFEYWADVLSDGSLEEQMQIFRERGSIEQLCSKVLNDSPTR